jgi:PadR family transcriptional regulator, regulatory protein PadR
LSYVYRLYVSAAVERRGERLPPFRQSRPGTEPARPMSINKDLVAASSTPLVLAILAEGDSYGYAILKRVRELSGGELEWTDGMLYPVLHRLERSGLIEARWDQAESGRKRKYYRVTEAGREQLAEERRQWRTVDQALRNIWPALAVAGVAILNSILFFQRG